MGLGLFRKRKKTRLADGTKVVTVTDRKGTVRKQKIVRPSGIKEKQKYNKAGDLHTAKLKGPGIRRTKLDVKNSSVTLGKSQGYQWAANPNKKSLKTTTPKTNTTKKTTPTTKVVINDGGKKTNLNTNVSTNTNKNTNKNNKPKSVSFGEAYSKQRKSNLANKIAMIGDSRGYFKWTNPKDGVERTYNTESKEEKTKRLAKKKAGGSVKGTGKWAGKNVPGMRYD